MKTSRILFVMAAMSIAGCSNQRNASPSNAADDATPEYPVITKLVGRHQTIVISAGPSSALYSIQSPDGRMLIANASFEELRDKHPEYYRYIQPVVATDGSVILSASIDASAE